jgi:stage II sporulation protein AA (anti-sigma F factor antagonist)
MFEYKVFKDSLFIRILGELDHATAPEVRQRIDAVLLGQKVSNVIFDLSGLSFCDSTGVGLILGRYKLLKANGKLLTIKAPTPAVDKVLSVSGIYTIVPKVI